MAWVFIAVTGSHCDSLRWCERWLCAEHLGERLVCTRLVAAGSPHSHRPDQVIGGLPIIVNDQLSINARDLQSMEDGGRPDGARISTSI
jgi:hypothetical protein